MLCEMVSGEGLPSGSEEGVRGESEVGEKEKEKVADAEAEDVDVDVLPSGSTPLDPESLLPRSPSHPHSHPRPVRSSTSSSSGSGSLGECEYTLAHRLPQISPGGGLGVVASGPESLTRSASNAVARLGLTRGMELGGIGLHTELFAL